MLRRLIALSAAGLPTSAWAQAVVPAPQGLDLAGTIRLRYETIDGQARAGVPARESSTQLRTILHATYRAGPLTLGGELYDSRALDGGTPSALTTAEVDAIEPVQAYVALDWGTPSRLSGRLTAGRQTVDLRSRRLIANDDYRNTTNGFTGVRLDLANGRRWNLVAWYLLPQLRLPDDAAGLRRGRVRLDREGFDTRLYGASIARPLLLGRIGGDVGVYRFEERDRPGRATRDRRLTTLTARMVAPPARGDWDGEIEAMRQTGAIRASATPGAARLPVTAWFVHGEGGYQWPGGWRPHLVGEADWASGDRRDGRYRRFDTLFGMRRADLGPAGLYNAVTRTNLIAVGPRMEVTPSRRLDAFVTVKKLWLASARDAFATTGVVDARGRSGRDAGWQTDARLRFWAVPARLQIEADGVWLAKGRFLREAPNRTATRDTLYVSVNASVSL